MQRKWKRRWQRLIKTILPPLAASMLCFSVYNPIAWANPTGGTVTAGSGSITENGANTTIIQTSDKLALNWQSFSIAKGETVNFLQPGASAVALNRVVGNSASAIYGALNASGKVFLINPNGILFAPGAQVNVGSLVASTLKLSDADFLKGKYNFSTNGSGTVINQGTIKTTDGGYVAFLGNQVGNEGVIVANKGSVALAAGNAATLDFTGDGLINLSVSQEAIDAQAANSGLVQADGGLVVMTAKAAGNLTGTVINNSGIIRAQSIEERNGKIVLDGGSSGVVSVSGTLDASGKTTGLTGGTVKVLGNEVSLTSTAKLDVSGDQGGGTALIGGAYQGDSSEKSASATTVETGATITADAITNGDGGQVVVWANDTTKFAGAITARGGSVSGNGGSVETSGKKTLQVGDAASVNTLATNGTTGNWLLDPYNLIISSGGDSTSSGFTASGDNSVVNVTTLTDALATTSVTILTGSGGSQAGDITVAAAVNWSGNTTLTLNAANNININNAITINGTGGLSLVSGNDIAITNSAITYNGSGASAVELKAGRTITLTDAIIQSTAGALDVTLSAGLTTPGEIKLLKSSTGSKIISQGGDILLGGAVTGGVLSAMNGTSSGIRIINSQLESGTGNIELKSEDGFQGIVLTDSKLTTTTGNILLEGSSSSGSPSKGISMQGTISRDDMAITTQGGNITILGSSGGGTDWGNYGLWIIKTLIQTSGNGAVTLEGTAGAGTNVANGQNMGIKMINDSLIQTVNGAISLTGTGAASTAEGFNYGIWLYDSALKSTGTGNIQLQGTGGSGGNYNFGVAIDKSTAGTGSSVTTNSGSITITGTGGADGIDRRGFYSVNDTTITSTSGNISLTGTGTNSLGYALTNRSVVTTGGMGTISLIGRAVSGLGGSVSSTGSLTTDKQAITIIADGNITLNGNINAGTTLNNTGGVITLQSNGGTVTDTTGITIAADGLVLKGVGASHVLDDANYIIGRLAADTGSITFVQTGGISIDTVGTVNGITATGPVTITTPSPVSGSATLYINKPITITSSTPTTLTLRSGNDLILNQGSSITAGNKAVNVVMASNLSGNGGYVDLLQNSAVTTNGGSLTIGGGSNGTDYAVAADPYNYEGVWIATSTINTGAGDITIHGKGYNGVRINGGSLNTTSGNILLDGIGDASGGTGVFIKAYASSPYDGTTQATIPAVIQTDIGNITIKGTSNNTNTAAFGDQLYFTGVNIWSDSRDLTEATSYKGAYITSQNGTITITGYRSATDTSSSGNAGINISSLTRIETTGTGNIILSNDSSGASTHANDTGIILAGDILASGSGDVSLRGLNGLALTGGHITASSGNISLYATGNATQVDATTSLSSGAISGNLLLTGSASYTLTSGQNAVQTLAGSTGNLDLVTGTSLTVGNSGITASGGDIIIQAVGTGSNITLSGIVNSSGNITLAAGRNFINQTMPLDIGLQPGGGYYYYVYSTSPDNTTKGMTTGYNEHYDQTYTSGVTPPYATNGNWFLYTVSQTPTGGGSGGPGGGGTPTTPTMTNEQVETAITHSTQTTATPPATAPTTANGTGSTTTQAEVVQTGVNVSGIATMTSTTSPAIVSVPSVLQVTPANGQSTSYSVVVTGPSLTVSLTGTNTAGETGPATTGSVAVVRAGEGTQTTAYYSATGSSGSLTLTPTGANGQIVPPEPVDNASATSFSLSTSNGAQAEFQILYADGAVSIWPTNEAAAALMQAGGDNSKLVVTAGILVAQQNLGVTVQAVYLH